MWRTASIIFAGLALAAPASGQAFVIGGGLAKDCYNEVLQESSRLAEAERTCTQALQQEAMTASNRAATYVNRGIARMRQGKLTQANEDYGRALDISPEMGEAYLNIGAAHIYGEDFSAAIEALDKAIELEAKDLHAAHYNRAIARENLGDVEGAYVDFRQALELKPDWERAQRQLARFEVKEVEAE